MGAKMIAYYAFFIFLCVFLFFYLTRDKSKDSEKMKNCGLY